MIRRVQEFFDCAMINKKATFMLGFGRYAVMEPYSRKRVIALILVAKLSLIGGVLVLLQIGAGYLGTGTWVLVFHGIVLAAIMTLVLRNTVFGRRVFAIGSNELAARACGINTDRLKIRIYSIAGLFFGLAGVTQMSRLRQGDPTVAVGVELDVIAAVVIGGGSLSGGEGSIPGAMIGALVMSLLRNGCQQMGWANYVQEIIIGVIIVIAVAADRYRASRATERTA